MFDLRDIFGDEIKVKVNPRRVGRNFYAFAGSHGLVSSYQGTRGYDIIVKGRLRAWGTTYDIALGYLQDVVDILEEFNADLPTDYMYRSITIYAVLFGQMKILEKSSRSYHWTTNGEAWLDFTYKLTSLI